MTKPPPRAKARRAAAVSALLLACAGLCSAQGSNWTLAPYRVRALVTADSFTSGGDELADRVASHFSARADAAVGALWDLECRAVPAGEAAAVRGALSGAAADRQTLVELSASAQPEGFDKLLLIDVKETARGITVRVIEYDATLMRWGRVAEEEVASLDRTPEAAFRLAVDAFSPLAEFELAPDDADRVELTFRGEDLPRPAGAPDWVRQNDVMLPVLRQLDREGAATADGIREVPWTYLVITEAGEAPAADLVSHTRRPLSARRRGRVERLAVRIPRREAPITLHAHAKDHPDQPLVGYQVFVQDGADAPREPVGVTGPDGRLTIEPGASPVLLAYIKCGSQLVAKLPVVPGSADELDVPLLDETVRLNAEAKLGILREDLIDLVARRQIYVARINAAIDAKQFDSASRLIDDLERLPARALFDRRLRQLEQGSAAESPMVQRRIDRVFDDTRTVLAEFLSPREVRDVKTRLANARKEPAPGAG